MLLTRSSTNTTFDKPRDGLKPGLANKADFMKNCTVLTEKALLIEYKNNRERSALKSPPNGKWVRTRAL